MKFNHDGEKLSEVIVGVKLDPKKMSKLTNDIMNNPDKVLGKKKSHTAEYIRDNIDDPEILLTLANLLCRGVVAIRVMDAMEQRAKDEIRKMDPKDVPPEVLEALRESDAQDAVDAITKPSDDEVDDEFAKLQKKYR